MHYFIILLGQTPDDFTSWGGGGGVLPLMGSTGHLYLAKCVHLKKRCVLHKNRDFTVEKIEVLIVDVSHCFAVLTNIISLNTYSLL